MKHCIQEGFKQRHREGMVLLLVPKSADILPRAGMAAQKVAASYLVLGMRQVQMKQEHTKQHTLCSQTEMIKLRAQRNSRKAV